MENEKQTTVYLVPANVTARFEIFAGFGWEELMYVGVTFIISLMIFFVLGLPQKTVLKEPAQVIMQIEELNVNADGLVEVKEPVVPMPIKLIVLLMPSTFMYFIVKKEPTSGLSTIDSIKRSIQFKKRQAIYMYKYNSGSK